MEDVFVKENYVLMGIVLTKSGIYHAIIYRDRTQDYVVCCNYNIKDGTWGAGTYVVTYEAAIEELKMHI